METAIGFAIGYWIGSRQGREGIRQALDSARAIWESPETRRLVAEGLSALEAVGPALDRMGKHSGNSRARIIGSAMDEFIERRQRRSAHAA